MTITYTDEQERAMQAIVEWYGREGDMEFYMAGYAGTGKSTVCYEAIARIIEKYKIYNVPTGAFTGKAAFVLRKKNVPNAQTIHSMIYTPVEDPETHQISFVRNPLGTAATADLIVLDECSMIDDTMANDLRAFGKKILVMGDPGQLPPINGAGSFTRREPDVFLREIHRQAADSPIIKLATMARKGERLPLGFNEGGVQVLELTNETQELLHNPDTQVLCGLNRIRWAVTDIMRKRLGFEGVRPLVGERIICCKNNKEKGLFNGGMGVLKSVTYNEAYDVISEKMALDSYKFDVRMEDQNYDTKKLLVDPYLFRQHFEGADVKKDPKKKRNEFDWGYVVTCHKAQGSSWPHVTMIDDSDSFRENKSLWLYTAITRAEEGLTILIK